MTAFCALCGNTDPADLGQAIGICLDKDACHRRQYARLRDRADAATARAEVAEAELRRDAGWRERAEEAMAEASAQAGVLESRLAAVRAVLRDTQDAGTARRRALAIISGTDGEGRDDAHGFDGPAI